jgi:hypothetical protein
MNAGGIFVNYRVGDKEDAAVLIASRLVQTFGADYVFRASRSIGIGMQFDTEIMNALNGAAALLAIIGPHWADVRDERGNRRLDDPDDWVRREIAVAIRRGILVAPVLVGDAARLSEVDLPEDVRRLASSQYRRYHYRSAEEDLDRLVENIAAALPSLPRLTAAAGSSRVIQRVHTIGPGGAVIGAAGAASAAGDRYVAQEADEILGLMIGDDQRPA